MWLLEPSCAQNWRLPHIPQVDSITDSCMHSGAEQKIAIVRRLGSVASLALAQQNGRAVHLMLNHYNEALWLWRCYLD